MGVWYSAERDGTIEEYIARCRDERIPPCFKGYDQYKKLFEKGILLPGLAMIRLREGCARHDECYLVVGENRLEGLELMAHSGHEGIHDPRELLSGDDHYFEIAGIDPSIGRE